MEHTKSGESSASSGEEPNAKRRRGDVDANAKSVVVLLDSDVTVSKNGLKVFMPNTIEMAKLKKSEKGQYGKMTFTSQMTDRDVLRALHCTFPILRNRRRLGCASAVENRTRLNFHGERRLWNGKLIKRRIRGNSALYLLAEGSRESEESQVLPSVSVAARRPQDVYTSVAGPTQQKQPVLSLQTRQEGLSVPAASSMNSIPLQQSLVQDMTVGKRTSQWRSFSQQSTTTLPSGKQKNGTSSFAISGSPGCDKSAENLTFQAMQHRFTSSATSTEKSSLQVRGLSSEQSVNKDIMTTPVQHHCQADLSVKTTNWGSSSKQSMPTSVAQGSSVAATQKLKELSQISLTAGSQQSELNDQTLEQGSTWQQVPIGAAAHPKLPFQDFIQETTSTEKLSVNERKRKSHPHGHQEFPLLLTASDEETSDSAFDSMWEEINESDHYTGQSGGTALVATQKLSDLTQIPSTTSVSNANNQGQPELLQRGQEDLTALAAHTTGGILQQRLLLVQERQNDFIVKTIADPGAQENAQTSEQGCSLQQALAAAAAHKNVPAQVFNQETTSRKSRPHGHQENSAFELLCGISDGEITDSAIDSMWEEITESDHVTGQSGDILKEICPNKGSIKGGDRFHLIMDFPLEIEWCKAIFQGCGEVDLQRASFSTLAGITPASLQGPGKVKVTLMSLDGSWWGGETEFLYTEDPLTEEEFLSKVVKDRNMRRKLFDRMDKEMSSNKPSDEQTSDSFGKTGPRSSSLNQSRYTWSVKLLQLLVYKAAEIDGHEFIKMIFSTSAGKVVFNSYRNSARLPEDVARANGHSTLANHLQDVNSRLSKESNSDARTEGIDWLELKHTVDKEQSLPSDADDVQILKKCRPPGYPESDDDDESDYFADDEISPCSSPSLNKVSDSEHEDHSQNTKRNQLEVNPSIKAENAGYRNEQLESDEVKSHTIANDILIGKEYGCTSFKTDGNDLNESAVTYRSEVENWDTLGSEMISTIEEASTGTISLHNAALPNNSSHQDSDDVMATDGSETGLDGAQREFKMIDNDETTRSRDISTGEESSSSCSTRELPCSSELRDTRRSVFPESSKEKLALMYRPSSSMVCTNEREFNAHLVRIADEITKKEVQEMKFLYLESANNLPRGILEEIKEPREFVNFLRVRGKIWHEDVGYLIWLLNTTGNVRLADMIRERVIPGSPSSPGPGKPGILPCLTPNFIGRKEDVEKIITKLRAKLRMIVIVSPPGMGKTEVAIRVSHLLKTRERLSVIYVERLDNLTDICGEILARLSTRPWSTSVDLISHAKYKLSKLEKDTVIVLDNTEDVQGKEFDDFAEWLVKSAPKVQLIITTREDVGFVSADIHKVQLEPLDANLSAELLRKLDVNCSEEQVQDLGELCGGIPLLLINCACLLKDGFNPEVLIQELRNNPIRLLKSNAKEVYDAQGRFVKMFSEDLITNLVVLSVFPSTFSPEDIEFLFEGQLQLEMVKTKMLKCTLLQKGNDQKLSLHPLLQAYCRTERDSLNMVDVGCNAQRKFNCHYLELLKSLSKKFISKNSALVAIQTLRDQEVNIIAALKNCFEDVNDTDQKGLAIDVVNSTEVLDFLAKVLSPPKECAELFRKCCDITKTSGDKRRHAESLNSLGFRRLVDVACSKDELEGSRVTLQLFKEVLDIRKTLPEEDQKCQTHAHTISNLGLCHVLQGDEEKGRALIKEGIKMREELGVSLYIAAGNCDLGNSYRLCGDHQTAIEIWKKNTLPVYMEELGDHPWTASILNFIADSYKVLATERSEHGYAEQAEMYFRQALELRRRLLGFHQDTARSHVSLSDVLVILGNSQSALDELEKALEIQKDVLGPQHKNTIDTLNKITDICDENGCKHRTKET